MEVTIQSDYHGLCNVCNKDVFSDHGILGWIEFLEREDTPEQIKITEAMDKMGLEMPTGCWASYHPECIPPDMETKECP